MKPTKQTQEHAAAPHTTDDTQTHNGGAWSTRRNFLRRASFLSLAIPGVGGALIACDGAEAGMTSASGSSVEPEYLLQNSDSGRDKRLEHEPDHRGRSMTGQAAHVARDVRFHRFDPTLPPPPRNGILDIHYHSRETPIRISSDTVVNGWTFEDNIPAPILHCRVGDTVNFKLTNDMYVPHSMDFHAAQINPMTAFRSVPKDESVSYSFKPRNAGVFMYHCGTPPMLMHIGMGMFGAIVVSPRKPLPPAREFVLIQNEYYLGEAINGIHSFDYDRMLSGWPDLVAFNGRPRQYGPEPLRVKVGDRVRFWVVNAGPTRPCAFHLVGEQFETVYLGEPPHNAIHGVQTFEVAPGGGMAFELTCNVPGKFMFVNHALGHGQKGAIGHMVVEP